MKPLSIVVSVLLVLCSVFSISTASNGMKEVMNSKAYWENEEKTAKKDINKLTDGLDELSENEETYYKGLKDYLQGQLDYEEGKQKLADGKAELAAGEKKVAAGEAELASGEAAYAQGIKTIRDTEKKYGGKGVPVLKAAFSNVNRIVAAKNSLDKSSAIVAGGSGGKVNSAQVKTIYSNVNELKKGYSVDKAVATAAAKSGADKSTIKSVYNNVTAAKKNGLSTNDAIEAVAFASGKDSVTAAYEGVAKLVKGYSEAEAIATVAATAGVDQNTVATAYKGVQQAMGMGLPEAQAIGAVAAQVGGNAMIPQITAIYTNVSKLVKGYSVDEAVATAAAQSGADKSTIKTVYTSVAGLMAQGASKDAAIKKVAVGAAKDQVSAAYNGVDKLVRGYSAEEAYGAVAEAAGKNKADIKNVYTKLTSIKSGLSKGQAEAMVASSAGKTKTEIHKAYNGYLTYVSGKRTLAAAPSKLAAGKNELAKGKRDLAAGREELAKGKQDLKDGKKKLTEGEEKLAEFEDGRAQVIEGMETLISTEPYPNIDSIKQRLGSDYNYMKNETDINYTTAREAITQANAFLKDTGSVVTAELTKKTYGYIAGIVAAVLAILAALASVFIKNKKMITAIFGVPAAVAAVAAITFANQAGSTMSEIAGAAPASSTQTAALAAIAVCAIATSAMTMTKKAAQ